jgi:hypothetical protein
MKLEETLTKPASEQLESKVTENSACNNAVVEKAYKIGLALFHSDIRQR